MAQKNRFYRVRKVATGLKKSYPMKEVAGGTVVRCLESAPQGTLDVIDVQLNNGKVRSVYSFQLVTAIQKPKNWGK